MSNTPLDKGRVAVIADKYQTNQFDQNGQPVMKNRYASVGRATLWPNKQNSSMPNVEVEIDTLPMGHSGSLKLYIFWDSEGNNNQGAQQPAPQYQQQPAPQYQQQNNVPQHAPASYGTPPPGRR